MAWLVTPHILALQKRTIGEVLLTEVFKHLSLEENDYFGLQFLDSKKDHVVSQMLPPFEHCVDLVQVCM